jgi:hypothetical protein
MKTQNVLLASFILTLSVLLAPSALAQRSKPNTPPVLEQRLGIYDVLQFDGDRLSYNGAMNVGDVATGTRKRNEIAFHVIGNIDYGYGQWRGTFTQERNKQQFFFDIGENALVSAIGLTSINTTKNIFTAVLQFGRGTRKSYETNFFKGQTITVIFATIDAARLNKLTEIQNKLSATTAQEYPLDEAMADTIAYFNEGTLAAGLQRLGEAAGASLQAARANAVSAGVQRVNAIQQRNAVPKQ